MPAVSQRTIVLSAAEMLMAQCTDRDVTDQLRAGSWLGWPAQIQWAERLITLPAVDMLGLRAPD